MIFIKIIKKVLKYTLKQGNPVKADAYLLLVFELLHVYDKSMPR